MNDHVPHFESKQNPLETGDVLSKKAHKPLSVEEKQNFDAQARSRIATVRAHESIEKKEKSEVLGDLEKSLDEGGPAESICSDYLQQQYNIPTKDIARVLQGVDLSLLVGIENISAQNIPKEVQKNIELAVRGYWTTAAKKEAKDRLVEGGMSENASDRAINGRRLKGYWKGIALEPWDFRTAPEALKKIMSTKDLFNEEQADKKMDINEKDQKGIAKSEFSNHLATLEGKTNSEKIESIITQFSQDQYAENKKIQYIVKRCQEFQSALDVSRIVGVAEDDQAKINNIANTVDFDFTSDAGMDTSVAKMGKAIEESDISDVAKETVLKNLGVQVKVTGNEINQSLDKKDSKGKPLYNKENPLRMQGGIDVYVNENGQKVVKGVNGRETRVPNVESTNPDLMMRKAVFVSLVRGKFDAYTGGRSKIIFGQDNKGGNVEKEYVIAKHFVEGLLRQPFDANIPNRVEMDQFDMSLDAMTNNKDQGNVDQFVESLKHLGVLADRGALASGYKDVLRGLGSYYAANDYMEAQNTTIHADEKTGDDGYTASLKESIRIRGAEKINQSTKDYVRKTLGDKYAESVFNDQKTETPKKKGFLERFKQK